MVFPFSRGEKVANGRMRGGSDRSNLRLNARVAMLAKWLAGFLICVLAMTLVLMSMADAQDVPLQKIPKPRPAQPRLKGVPMPKQVHAKWQPLPADVQVLTPYDMSPFPFDGVKPNEGTFLNIFAAGRRGHATGRGGTNWEDTTYNDRRVLLYLPKGFDIRKPATLVVFFHVMAQSSSET